MLKNFIKIFWHNLIIIKFSGIIIKKFSELNKSAICTFTLCLSREVKKKLIVTQSWYNSIVRFFQFHTLLVLEMEANLTGLLYGPSMLPDKAKSVV